MKKLPQGEELKKRAEELGIPQEADFRGTKYYATDPVLQRRVQEAERSRREGWWWIFALISAIASVGSAVAAILAVCLRSK